MKAAVYRKYGPPEVVKIENVEKPVPKDNEVLVKIHATTASAGDWRLRKADPFLVRIMNGIFKPTNVKILGYEIAGEVEAIGKNVKRFKTGDQVFSFTGFGFGGHAEYICIPEEGKLNKAGVIALKPVNMSYEEAAAIPSAGITASGMLKKLRIQSGQSILIYGASGAVGVAAVQLAKYYGAEVTGVCSGANVEMVKSLGADKVIDYKKEDFTENKETYDIILDAVDMASRSRSKKSLKKNGIFMSSHEISNVSLEDLLLIKKLVEEGKYKAVIDRTYPLEEIVEAHRYVESWRKKGSVVIIV